MSLLSSQRCASGFKPEVPKPGTCAGPAGVSEEGSRGPGAGQWGCGPGPPRLPGPPTAATRLQGRPRSRAAARFPPLRTQLRSGAGSGRAEAHLRLGLGPAPSSAAHAQSRPPPAAPRSAPERAPAPAARLARTRRDPRPPRGGRRGGVRGQRPQREAVASPPAGLALALPLALRLPRAPRG